MNLQMASAMIQGLRDFLKPYGASCGIQLEQETQLKQCDARLCREHVCYDDTLPYCRRCRYWDDDAVELIEVGEWR
jgi:hypothetical protein